MPGVNGNEGHGASVKRVEDPPFLRGTRPVHGRPAQPRGAVRGVRAVRVRARADQRRSTRRRRPPCRAWSASTPPRTCPGGLPDRRPARRHAGGDAPAGARQGPRALHRRAGRGRRRRHPRAGRGREPVRRRRLRAARRARRHDQGARRRRAEALPGRQPRRGRPSRQEALEGAEVRVAERFINQRVAAVPMEPGAAMAAPDPDTGGFILWTPSQGPHAYQGTVSKSTGIEKDKLRVISTATGGGFGARIACYPEQIVVVALARELGARCATSRRARRRCSRCSTAARRCRTSRSAARATARSPA